MITKQEFLDAYRAALVEEYDWAQDEAKLGKFMKSVTDTVNNVSNRWHHDSSTARRIWRRLAIPGNYSLKALRALPAVPLLVFFAGCTTVQPDVSATVKATCGAPLPDLSNVDAYATCVNAVLDTLDFQNHINSEHFVEIDQ